MSFGTPFADKYADQLSDNPKYAVGAKYVFPNDDGSAAPGMTSHAVNKKIIRYADVLLMYAEAENEANGPTTAAHDAINKVRARATMADLDASLTKDQFREKVRREHIELTLEDLRQIDLMRWGQYPQRILDNPEFRNGNLFYVQGREYFPIPQVEVDTNPNIKQTLGIINSWFSWFSC